MKRGARILTLWCVGIGLTIGILFGPSLWNAHQRNRVKRTMVEMRNIAAILESHREKTGTKLILNSGSHADLSAPTTGPYAGILVYQDRNDKDGSIHLLNSDADSVFIGTIYVPNGRIKINSGTTLSGTAPYTNFIARTFEIDANSGIVLNTDYAATDVPVPAGLATTNSRLVM